MKRNGLRGAIALALCLSLCIPVCAWDLPITLPDGWRKGSETENPFTDLIYKAIDFSDFVKAAEKLLSLYDGIASEAGGEYASGRLIVGAESALPDLSGYHAAQILADADFNYLIQFKSAEEAKTCGAYLSALSYVNFCEPDRAIILSEPDRDAMEASAQSNSWGVEATKAGEYARNLKARGFNSEIKVAVLDSGVDSGHPFLSGRVTDGYDLVEADAKPQDGNGHGTHVAGTIVDCTPDLNIKIMPIRVLNNEGAGSVSIIGLGIRYAADHGANVINMSLGGEGSSPYLDSQIKYAISKNAVVVVAAGNENADTRYCSPAGNTSCVTVAAVDKSKSRANFSNYGEAVDIAAPGVGIRSCVPGGGYETWDGTSMAAPHAAAAAALLLYENPSQTPSQIETRLRNAAQDLGKGGWDSEYGAGFLNMAPFIQSGSSGSEKPQRFTDVSPGSYCYDAVMWAVEEGITNGTTETTFSPNQICTTKQILTFMWRADGLPQPKFLSVLDDFGKAMAWASEAGISEAVAASAEDACTRASAMTYIWQRASRPKAGSASFSDVPNNAYYTQAVCWAVSKGITKGTTANTFSPDNPCTRGQIVTFLYRYYVTAANS